MTASVWGPCPLCFGPAEVDGLGFCAIHNEPCVPEAGLYWWVRSVDETGMSGAGKVAQVAVFEDGSAVLRWLKARNTAGVGSTVLYDSVRDLIWVHGHGEKRTGHLERDA